MYVSKQSTYFNDANCWSRQRYITRKRTITDDVNEGRGLPQAFVDRINTTTEVDGAICYIQGLNREWIVSQVRPAMTRIVIHITEDVTQF